MIDWLLSVVWYSSFLAFFVGVLALIRPIRRLRIRSRRAALGLVAIAVVAVLFNANIAPSMSHTAIDPESALERVLPAYHFREVHARTIAASSERVLRAVKEVTAGEIALFTAFTSIRRFGQPGAASILNAPPDLPLLEIATRTTFLKLAETDREIVVGTFVVAPRSLEVPAKPDVRWFTETSRPGLAKAAMNFALQPLPSGLTRLTTETRVFGTDTPTVRRFTPYWRTIFPGSWILRVTWLGAIAKRAEGRQ